VPYGWGLGKSRSKLGKWLDDRGISQQWLSKKSGVSRTTISEMCSDQMKSPNLKTIQKVLKAIRDIDPRVKQDDFWSM
jgi:predicted transcriptional regulator